MISQKNKSPGSLKDNEDQLKDPRNGKSPDDESNFNKTIDSFAASGGKFCASQNIGVLNMTLEVPCSESLPPLEAAAISCILRECLNVLQILEYTIPAKVDERWDESYKSMLEKYGKCDETENIFREDMGLLPLTPTTAEKLQKDRTYVFNLFKEILDNIEKHRRFDRLKTEVDNIVKTIENERALRIDHEIWSDLVDQLRGMIDSQKTKKKEGFKNSAELIREAEVEADNSLFFNGSKLEYVKRWEEDRLDQQNSKMAQEEAEIINELREIGRMERVEQIVSEDLQAYLQDHIAGLEYKIKEWTNKHDREAQRRQMEIYDLKEAIEDQKETLHELYNLRDERQAFIDECYAEKARIKREEEYWKTTNRSATIIQSFWRGYMVRHLLGEYQGLWARLRKRKKLAVKAKKKLQAWEKKKAKQWGETKLKTMKNIVDPNA